jgi:hypothetical protein
LTYTAFFDGQRRFSTLFPDGRVITGVRLNRGVAAAGIYYAQTDRGDDAYILVERGGTVRAVVYDFDDNKIVLSGAVTGDTFEVSSPNGDKLSGRFAGQKISGRYLDGEGAGSSFDGARY